MPQRGVQPEWLKGKGGRPKGSPSKWKKEIYDDVMSQLAAHDFSLIGEFLRLYRSKKTNNEVRARLLLGLASIAFPKKLAIASHSRIEHFDRTAAMELMRTPEIAHRLEELTFLMGERPAGLLPAPAEPGERPVIDAEFTDVPNVHEREPSAGL